MAVSTDVIASTLQYILEQETEALKRRHAFLDYAEKAGGIVELDGGSKIQVPVALKDHSLITYHSDGYEATDETIQDVLNYAEFPWAFWTAPVALSAKRKLENSGERAIIDLYGAHLKSVMDRMGRDLNAQILNGSLVGTGLETLYGAAGAGVNAGFIEGVAKASQNNTVGGLSKATYNIPGWTNAFASAGGAFATNGKTGMDSIHTQILSVHQGAKPIDVVIASEAAFRLYKSTLFVNERYTSDSELDGGRMSLMFGGAPVVPDLAMTVAGRAADAIFSMYFLNFAGVKVYFHTDGRFNLVERGRALGYATDTWQVQLMAQLAGIHLGSLGVLTNGDA
jgi:hypothetical protein